MFNVCFRSLYAYCLAQATVTYIIGLAIYLINCFFLMINTVVKFCISIHFFESVEFDLDFIIS